MFIICTAISPCFTTPIEAATGIDSFLFGSNDTSLLSSMSASNLKLMQTHLGSTLIRSFIKAG